MYLFVGICSEISNTNVFCQCTSGWEDDHCQTMINYCADITCLNNGVCRPILLDYQCECLDESYTGRHCEIQSNKIIVLQVLSKSVGYIAIVAILTVAIFIFVMDVLKYYFGIDTVDQKPRQRRQRKKYRKKKKKFVIAIRYIYVNAPSEQSMAQV